MKQKQDNTSLKLLGVYVAVLLLLICIINMYKQ